MISANKNSDNADYWIRSLSLVPHPEGGFFRESYRSTDIVPADTFAGRFNGARNVCTGIYYLVTEGNFSAFHRIRSDEMWHFYAGGPLELHVLNGSGLSTVTIGRDVGSGELLQYVVPAGAWFASAPAQGSTYSLLGCTVSPGFDFADFELADRSNLALDYPGHTELITRYTRKTTDNPYPIPIR